MNVVSIDYGESFDGWGSGSRGPTGGYAPYVEPNRQSGQDG